MICFRITMQEKGILEEKKTKQTAFSGDEGLVLFNVYITILIHRHTSMDSYFRFISQQNALLTSYIPLFNHLKYKSNVIVVKIK